jgi:hypothetical protein
MENRQNSPEFQPKSFFLRPNFGKIIETEHYTTIIEYLKKTQITIFFLIKDTYFKEFFFFTNVYLLFKD